MELRVLLFECLPMALTALYMAILIADAIKEKMEERGKNPATADRTLSGAFFYKSPCLLNQSIARR